MNNAQFDMLGMFHIYICIYIAQVDVVYVGLLMDGLSLHIFDDIGILYGNIMWLVGIFFFFFVTNRYFCIRVY